MMPNIYMPVPSKILSVKKHTDIEYTFRMEFHGHVLPGQFFEVSIPKYGEAPISVSGIGEGYVDFTIRRVGKVTNEIFERYEGESLFLRGPYGNGFDIKDYQGNELVIVAGGTGVSPVRGVIEHFSQNPEEVRSMFLVAGFKSASHILFAEDFKRWESRMNVILTVDEAEGSDVHPVGLVTEYIRDLSVKEPKQAKAIVVGPPPMMRFTVEELKRCGYQEENIWVSYERKMCCGVGKCGHCKMGDRYVCLDGPVFRYTQAREISD